MFDSFHWSTIKKLMWLKKLVSGGSGDDSNVVGKGQVDYMKLKS